MVLILEILTQFTLLAAPLWIAVLVGLLVGWAWRPGWVAGWGKLGDGSSGPLPIFDSIKGQLPRWVVPFVSDQSNGDMDMDMDSTSQLSSPGSSRESKRLAVGDEDFEHLFRLTEEKDGGPAWAQMMERSLPNMRYRAWKREPDSGPPQYRSSTIFEDAAPELVKDFFWDDEFRVSNCWDDMLLYHNTLEECPTTGMMIVHWIRKFPFFCSDREYTIGRRMWQMGRSYYCVTKGVPYPSLPRRNKPRRVDLYYSSWCIRAAESKRDGQMTACEVLLFHHEDMGIPWEIAKLGVRQGMWGCVKKIEPGLRAYQTDRISGVPLSRSAATAQIITKVSADYLKSLQTRNDKSDLAEPEKQKTWCLPKLLVVGGAVALACTLDHGLVTKAVIFGVARRFANLGKKL